MDILVIIGIVVLNMITQFVLGLHAYKFIRCGEMWYIIAYRKAYIEAFKKLNIDNKK